LLRVEDLLRFTMYRSVRCFFAGARDSVELVFASVYWLCPCPGRDLLSLLLQRKQLY
jgi:hypothetical protein